MTMALQSLIGIILFLVGLRIRLVRTIRRAQGKPPEDEVAFFRSTFQPDSGRRVCLLVGERATDRAILRRILRRVGWPLHAARALYRAVLLETERLHLLGVELYPNPEEERP